MSLLILRYWNNAVNRCFCIILSYFPRWKEKLLSGQRFLMEELLRKFSIPQYQIGLFSISAYVHSDTSPDAGRYCKTGARKFRDIEHNSLRSSGLFIYHQLWHPEILRSAHTLYLWVLFGSQNKQRLFPYTTLSDWCYNWEGVCLLRGTHWIFKYNSVYSYSYC